MTMIPLYILSFLSVAFAWSNPDIQVQILPDLPPLKIQTYLSSIAPASKQWQAIMTRAEDEFPDVDFETLWVTPEDFEGKTVGLPFSKAISNGRAHMYRYGDDYRFVRRWIADARTGRFSLFWNVSMLDPEWMKTRPMFVHILSSEKPRSAVSHLLPEVTFAWSQINRLHFKNTVIVRDIDGRIRQKNNFSEYQLLHELLPPIIPNWMLDTDAGLSIFQTFTDRVINIVHDGYLEPWWNELAFNYSRTAFVLLRSNETSLRPVPSVWFERRSVQFMIPSVGPEARGWLDGIPRYTTQPTYRASRAPETPHAYLTDVTGDTFAEWLRNHTEAVLHLYDETVEYDLEPVFEDLRAANVSVGRMDMSKNDHEYLPSKANIGMCLHFVNTSMRTMKQCEEFDFTLGQV